MSAGDAATALSIVIADDQLLLRAGFRKLLDGEDGLRVVGDAADGQQAVELAGRLHPDVVLMDIRMPVLDGIESTRRICALYAQTAPCWSSRPTTSTSTSLRHWTRAPAGSCSRTARQTS